MNKVEEILRLLSPSSPRANLVIIVLTTDDNAYPHPALLSPYQVVTTSPTSLYLCVHSGTTTDHHLATKKKGTLVLFLPPRAIYVKFQVAISFTIDDEREKVYGTTVTGLKVDYSEEAPITSPVLFDDTNIKMEYQLRFTKMMKEISKFDSLNAK